MLTFCKCIALNDLEVDIRKASITSAALTMTLQFDRDCYVHIAGPSER